MLADLGTPEGGFALGARRRTPPGVEGSTYVWTPAELAEVLGADDGRLGGRPARRHRPAGTFEHGTSTAAAACATRGGRRGGGTATGGSGARPAPAARRRQRPQPGPRRQGGARLERAGGRRAGRDRRAARPARPGRGGDRAAPTCWWRCTSTATAAGAGSPATARCGAPRAVLEDLGDLAEGLLALAAVTGETAVGHGGSTLRSTQVLDEFGDGDGPSYDTARATVDPRLGAGRDVRPTRPTTPTRAGRPRPRVRSLTAAALTRRHRVGAQRPSGRWRRRRRRGERGAAVRRLGSGGGRGAARRSARGRGRRGAGRPARRRPARGGARRHGTGPGRRGGRAGATDAVPLLAAARPGRRRGRGLRVPRLRLRPPDDRPGRAAPRSVRGRRGQPQRGGGAGGSRPRDEIAM